MPDAIPVSELVDLLRAVEDTVVGTAAQAPEKQHTVAPGGEDIAVRLSLVQIGRGSTNLRFVSGTSPAAKPAFRTVATAVKTADVLSLPRRTREGLRRLHDLSVAFNQPIEFRVPENKRPLATIRPDASLYPVDTPWITGETELYGKLERVGGAEPRAVLRTSPHEVVRFTVTERVARELAPHLYQWVGLVGEARWNPADHSIETFRLKSILPYEDLPASEALGRVREAAGRYWGDVPDVAAEVQRIRSEDD